MKANQKVIIVLKVECPICAISCTALHVSPAKSNVAATERAYCNVCSYDFSVDITGEISITTKCST